MTLHLTTEPVEPKPFSGLRASRSDIIELVLLLERMKTRTSCQRLAAVSSEDHHLGGPGVQQGQKDVCLIVAVQGVCQWPVSVMDLFWFPMAIP